MDQSTNAACNLSRNLSNIIRVKAQHAAQMIAGSPEDWTPIGASILAGAIDFRDGYGKVRGTAYAARDCEQSAWWSLLLARLAAGVKLKRVKRPDPTLVSIREWIERSLGRPLAMMKTWMGAPRFAVWLHEIIDKGADRMGGVTNPFAAVG